MTVSCCFGVFIEQLSLWSKNRLQIQNRTAFLSRDGDFPEAEWVYNNHPDTQLLMHKSRWSSEISDMLKCKENRRDVGFNEYFGLSAT